MKFDVVAVDLKTHAVRLMANDITESNAQAVIKMAVIRRGVENEFFVEAPVGKYKDGDAWIESE